MTQRQHSIFNQIVDIGFDSRWTYTPRQWDLIDQIWDIFNIEEIDKLEDELDRLRELCCCEQK